eukprot:GFYU01010398.1.p1 GENE.GFYU01010398.1~~GFYU01010398.1.p1  ORF type:complete len:177 (-),score=38.37 GFYU01010398.1:115-645(-)
MTGHDPRFDPHNHLPHRVQKVQEPETPPYDKYRDGPMRYLGYANEVGEAFRPLVKPWMANGTYAIAGAYVIADTYDKTMKVHKDEGDEMTYNVKIEAADCLLWQTLASVAVPGVVINRSVKALTTAANSSIGKQRLPPAARMWGPTLAGLALIPAIITPIDDAVSWLMDETFRKFL